MTEAGFMGIGLCWGRIYSGKIFFIIFLQRGVLDYIIIIETAGAVKSVGGVFKIHIGDI